MSLSIKKYALDYCGQKDGYNRAKDAYRAGSSVKLYYHTIGTDTDYSFYLNGQKLNPLYSRLRGYIVKFTMPEQDSKLICSASSSMFCNENGQETK